MATTLESSEGFAEGLVEEIRADSALGRRSRVTTGELTRDELKFQLAQNYLSGTGVFYTFIAGVLAKCTDRVLARDLAENVYEEATGALSGTKSHGDLYLDLCEDVGLSRDEIDRMEPIPEAQIKLDWYRHISGPGASFIEGLAAFTIGVEAQVPGQSRRIGEAMMEHYGVSREGATFYLLHDELDSDHAHTGLSVMNRLAVTDEERRRVRAAVRSSQRVQRLLGEGIFAAIDRKRAAAEAS